MGENTNLVKRFGETWINVIVNGILDEDPSWNNWQRRLRGYLNHNGIWSIVPAEEERNFYCVKPGSNKSSCEAQLRGLTSGGKYSFADRESTYYSKLTDADLEYLGFGSKIRFRCASGLPQFFICVRNP